MESHLSEENAQALLHKMVERYKWVIRNLSLDEAVDSMVNWMHCNGGDNTCLLMVHYKDNLRDVVHQILRESHDSAN